MGKAIEIGVGKMVNLQIAQQDSFNVALPQGFLKVMAGGAILLGSTFVPFLLTFNIATSVGLNKAQCQGASTPAAIAGLIVVVLSMVLTPGLRKLPVGRVAAIVAPILALLGVLTSLTM